MTPGTKKAIDHDDITAVIQRYIDGARTGNSDGIRSAFHEGATIFGYVGSDLLAGSIKQFFDWHDDNGPAAGLKAQIANIDFADSVATARLELDDWTGYRFTDLFTLLKHEGSWKITNKVFHLHG